MNRQVGFLATALVFRLVQDPPYLTERGKTGMRVDYIGFALLTLGVGALQIMLDKGQEDDWFGSRFITTLAVVAGECLPALVIYEWFRRDPLIDVRLFTNRNFATANLMMFLVGANSFATTVLVPQFLQTLMGYTAQKAGMVLSVGALFLLVEMPIVGRLVTVFQTRYLVAFGWVLLAGTMYLSTQQLDLAVSFQSVAWLRVLQFVPIPFIFIPTTTAVYIGVPAEKNNTVAGLVNFMRNIGSGVGTSIVTTLIARQSQFHQVHLVSRLAADNPSFQAQLNDMVQRLVAAKLRKRVVMCEKCRDTGGSLDRDSGLVAAPRRHEPRAADALVDTYGGRAESPRPHILEACPTAGPRRTSNKQAVGGTNDGCDDSGSADPPPRHLRQGRSHRSHGRLLTRVAAVHPERDVEGARGHSATVHDAVQGVRQARSVVPDAEAGRRRGHRLHPLEGRDGGQPP